MHLAAIFFSKLLIHSNLYGKQKYSISLLPRNFSTFFTTIGVFPSLNVSKCAFSNLKLVKHMVNKSPFSGSKLITDQKRLIANINTLFSLHILLHTLRRCNNTHTAKSRTCKFEILDLCAHTHCYVKYIWYVDNWI